MVAENLPDNTQAVFASDLHLGLGKPFVVERLKRVLTEVRRVNANLVLVGDMWHELKAHLSPAEVELFFTTILQLVYEKRCVLVQGNHDRYELAKLLRQEYTWAQLCDRHMLNVADLRVLCIHGDVFDRLIKHWKLLTWVGTRTYLWGAQIAGVLDRVFSRMPLLGRWFPVGTIVSNYDLHFERSRAAVRVGAVRLAQQTNCSIVIAGHTHEVTHVQDGGVLYVNPGAWTKPERCHFVTIDDSGVVTLWRAAEDGFEHLGVLVTPEQLARSP